jgi:hypothetical protein
MSNTVRGGGVPVANDLKGRDFFTDGSLVADPYAYCDGLRKCPVQWEQHHAVVKLSGYEEVTTMCRDKMENLESTPMAGAGQ